MAVRTDMGLGRIAALDLARTGALVAMAVYHFTYDLELFGFVAPGTVFSAGWRAFAMAVAASFLFLAGVSLILAHDPVLRAGAFLRRLGWIAGAAGLITAGTYYAMPQSFIFFGILHSIAVASILGLALRRLPAVFLAGLAVLVLVLPRIWASELFDPPWLWWVGLQTVPIRSVDYEPVFPWFAPFLLGMAAAKSARAAGLWERLARWRGQGRMARALSWPGRNSLLVYMLHQPVLIGLVWSAAQILR